MIRPDHLRNFSLFDGLEDAELESLAACAEKVAYERGTAIFAEDTPARSLYLLLDGWVDIFVKVDAQGDSRELATILTAGDLFGWQAIIEPYAYTATAVCASPVTAIQITGDDLQGLFATNVKLGSLIIERICQMIAGQLRAARSQMVKLIVND